MKQLMFLYVISAPSGTIVPRNVTGNHSDGFKVEFVPNEVGRHKISVKYADVEISGSPFFTEVYDMNLVRVGQIPDGIVKQPIHFDGMSKNRVIFKSVWRHVFKYFWRFFLPVKLIVVYLIFQILPIIVTFGQT